MVFCQGCLRVLKLKRVENEMDKYWNWNERAPDKPTSEWLCERTALIITTPLGVVLGVLAAPFILCGMGIDHFFPHKVNTGLNPK